MIKNNTIYECSKCGAQSSKWIGRCVECGGWGTVEQRSIEASKQESKTGPVKITNLNHIETAAFPRLQTGINEVDRVLGGGIVPGSLVLLGGEPGVGKSTLILQIAEAVAKRDHPQPLLTKEGRPPSPPLTTSVPDPPNRRGGMERRGGVLYISGEESGEQIKLRFDRLGIKDIDIQFLGETNLEIIAAAITEHKPNLAIVDSIQTVNSEEAAAGGLTQIRVATVKFLEVAKKNHIPIIIIGHITKDGTIAGPKTLEHLVDVVLYLEGDANNFYRLLRGTKNRFGSIDEIGVFEMTGGGMKEVQNPSVALLEDASSSAGTAIAAVMEGNRPLLVEVQALTSPTNFGQAARRAVGFDQNRLSLLLAVLSRRAKINLANTDVYLNIIGGIRIDDPGADLAVAAAIISSALDKPINEKTVFLGEVGLSGEVRRTKALDKRAEEAAKIGFTRAVGPKLKTPIHAKISYAAIGTMSELVNFIKAS